jgi:predicted 2-oxoglutarate/Fe(II)-dependent dioxygenase YbiX
MAFEISDDYTLEVLFTAEECNTIKGYASGDYYEAVLRSSRDGELEDHPEWCNAEFCNVDLDQLNTMLNSKNLPSVTWAKFMRFNTNEFYIDHSDCTIDEINTYKTIVIWLSDPSQYAGGDYLIRDTALDRSQGNVLQKQSWLRNSVATVNAGTVYYLIAAYTA